MVLGVGDKKKTCRVKHLPRVRVLQARVKVWTLDFSTKKTLVVIIQSM